MIKKQGGKWVLYSSDGKKKLGEHNTKEEALRQERAIQISKQKRQRK